MHAAFRIGETTVMASDGTCSGKTAFGGFALALDASDEPDAQRLFAALADGGQVQMPLGRTFFSPAFGMVADRFGVLWMVIVPAWPRSAFPEGNMPQSAARKPAAAGPVTLLVATRKGAFILKSDNARRAWKTTGPLFLGQIVHHMVLDPRDKRTLLAATSTGHLGPTGPREDDHPGWGRERVFGN